MERSHLSCALKELKFVGDENTMAFTGYGAVFNNVDYYGDVIAKGAFAETLSRARKSGDWPPMLVEHGGLFGQTDSVPVGVWTEMSEDESGLRVEGKLAPTPRGQEVYTLMKMTPRPAITGLSIGYRAKEWSNRTRPDEPRRTLKVIDLVEVSIVSMPANPKARVTGVKAFPRIQDFEAFLRDAGGFSATHAKRIASQGIRSLYADRDDGEQPQFIASVNKLINSLKR